MRAVISLGSNIEPQRHLQAACKALAAGFEVQGLSSPWESPPWGRTDQPAFVNAAALLEIGETAPSAVKRALQKIEDDLGRVRVPGDPNGPRTIDLDLSLVEGVQNETPPLPDGDLLRRWYVAVPAAEVAGDLTIPGDGRTIAEVAASLADEVDGERIAWSPDEAPS